MACSPCRHCHVQSGMYIYIPWLTGTITQVQTAPLNYLLGPKWLVSISLSPNWISVLWSITSFSCGLWIALHSSNQCLTCIHYPPSKNPFLYMDWVHDHKLNSLNTVHSSFFLQSFLSKAQHSSVYAVGVYPCRPLAILSISTDYKFLAICH